MNKKHSYERYQRQVLLQELGEQGQQTLLETSVLVIGAGGLGCPVLQYLAAAGTGTIGIVDHDTVALHNLHRQPLYSMADIGSPKALAAAAALEKLNPEIEIKVYHERLEVENAAEIMNGFNIIIDGTDNFATRYLINDACVLLDKPLVYGAISQYEGQVAIFNHCPPGETKPAVNYRDLFPEPPKDGEILNCEEAGVLGVLPGIIGTMMACETIKLITGVGKPLSGRMLSFNALNNQFYEFQITPRPGIRSLIPASIGAFGKMNYELLCAFSPFVSEIETGEFDQLLESGHVDVIDVREPGEMPGVNEFHHRRVPLQNITMATSELQQSTIVVFCQTGKRSRQAASLLSGIFGHSKKIFSLKGGILNWKQQHRSQAL